MLYDSRVAKLVMTMRSDINYINVLKSAELIAFGHMRSRRRAVKGGMFELYRLIAYENYFPSSRAARAHIRRKAKRLGVLRFVPGDAFPGNWAAFRVTVQQKMLARGIQLDLFEQLRRDTVKAKGKGQLGLF